MAEYFEAKTTDNITVYLRKEQIGAIEVVQPSARSEGYLKCYVSGYSFNLRDSEGEIFKELVGE